VQGLGGGRPEAGEKSLAEVATTVKPDSILVWYRKLVAQKFDGSKQRKAPDRPRLDPELEALIVRMARRIAPGATIGSLARWPTSA
jgi:hypothetical protein